MSVADRGNMSSLRLIIVMAIGLTGLQGCSQDLEELDEECELSGKCDRLPLTRVSIGTTSSPSNSPIRLRLAARFQNYKGSRGPLDVRDRDIYSPKSARYTPDGEKVYVNSLEGLTTVVYSPKSLTKLGTIKHRFDEQDASLFQETNAYDYRWFARSPGGDPNIFGGKPVESELSHGGRYLWIPYYRRDFDYKAQSPSAVAIVDTETDKIVRVMPTGPIPKFAAASPDGKWLALAHWGDNTVMFIDIDHEDPKDFRYGKHIAVGRRVDLSTIRGGNRDHGCGNCLRGMAFTKDSKHLFVARMGGGGIGVIDMAEGGAYRGSVFGMRPTPRHLVLSEDGKWLYMSSNASGYVSRVDVDEMLAAATLGTKPRFREVSVGIGARTISLIPGGRYLVAAINNRSRLSVVDTESFRVVATVPADSYPVGLAVSPSGDQLFVTSQGRSGQGGNSVSVYSIEER